MESMIGSGISLVDFAFYSALFVMVVVSLISRGGALPRWLGIVWSILFSTATVVALISSKPFETKVFVTLLAVSAIVVTLGVAVQRRSSRLITK